MPNLREFLGLLDIFQNFIPNYASRIKHLSCILNKTQNRNGKINNITNYFKNTILSKPVLVIFDQNLKTSFYTDAYRDFIGAILLHSTKDC